MAAHRPAEREHPARSWELRGMVRCSCGVLVGTHTVGADASKGRTHHYYSRRSRRERLRGCEQKTIRAGKLEAEAWDLVSGLPKDPKKLADGVGWPVEREASWRADGPDGKLEILPNKAGECARQSGLPGSVTLG